MIALRHILPIDFDDMKRYVTNDRVSKFLTWDSYKNENDIKDFFRKAMSHNAYPNEFLAIVYKNKMIGTVHLIERKGKGVQFGFGILPAYWGRGFGNAVITQAISYLKNGVWKRAAHSILADVHANNIHAIRVLEHSGFIPEGTHLPERLRYSYPL